MNVGFVSLFIFKNYRSDSVCTLKNNLLNSKAEIDREEKVEEKIRGVGEERGALSVHIFMPLPEIKTLN